MQPQLQLGDSQRVVSMAAVVNACINSTTVFISMDIRVFTYTVTNKIAIIIK